MRYQKAPYRAPFRAPYTRPIVPTFKPLANPTEEQKAIIDWSRVIVPGSRAVVKSLAGVGKTTTGIQAMANAPEKADCVCLAFATRNKLDFERKFSDPRWLIKTLTGFGFLFLMKAWGRLRLDYNADKNKLLIACPSITQEPQALLMAKQLLNFVQSTCVGIPSMETLAKIANDKGFTCDDKREKLGWTIEKLCQAVTGALTLAMQRPNDGGISFGDMNWSAVAAGLVRPSFDFILTDEAQDTNELTKELVRRALRDNGREILLGDDNQAIYGFRGSIPNAMELFISEKPSEIFTLSETFRCGKNIVEHAKQLVPEYRANSGNIDGEVVPSESVENMIKSATPGRDAILSRTNAPLMRHCLGFIAKGIPANVEGKDIGKELENRIKEIGGANVSEFIGRLNVWQQTKIAKLSGWNATAKAERINDDAETLRVLAESCASDELNEMTTKIRNIFTDSEDRARPVVVLSTVHKAKGLEWPRVSVLTETFSRIRVETPEQAKEEQNVRYVAWTRPKERLAFVS